MIKLPFIDRVTFLIERQFIKGAGFQLLIVAAVVALISITGGAAVMFVGGQMGFAEEADARVVVGQRIIEGLLQRQGLDPRILIELADAANEGSIRSSRVETLVSPMILSHFMAQVTLRRETRLIFDELFTAGGTEIEFRTPSAYGPADPASFAELESRVAARGDTLQGVQQASESDSPNRGLQFNPPRDTRFELQDDDRLCVPTRVAGD